MQRTGRHPAPRRKTAGLISERSVDYLNMLRGNQLSPLAQLNDHDCQAGEGTMQTGLNRKRIETRRSGGDRGLPVHLDFSAVRGAVDALPTPP